MAKVAPFSHRDAWTQAVVDARWLEIGNPGGIAPLLPASMSGMYLMPTRGGTRVTTDEKRKKMRKEPKAGAHTVEERKFFNFFNKVAVDPYRKQSGISKIAGGILDVASFVFPPLATMQAVATAGNTVLDIGKMGRDLGLATAQLTKAADAAYAAQASVLPPALPVAQLAPPSALVALAAPPPSALPAVVAPATPAVVSGGRVVRKLSRRDEYILAGIGVLGVYLLTRK
jgi:hypothetical protein